MQARWLTIQSRRVCTLLEKVTPENQHRRGMSQSKILKSSEPSVKQHAVGVGRSLVRLVVLCVTLCILLIGVAWAFGALWFDFPVSGLRQPLAAGFGLSAIAALVFARPHWRAQLGVAGAIVLVAAWELAIPPSNTRDWQPQVAEAPYVEINGDRVVIHSFRNFDYLSKTEFRPRWETKTVQLSNLRAVDFFTNFWGPTLICHTFLSFDFGPDGYVCISIETRMAQGQNYSALAGLYRQFELYYVIGDERDIVRVRTNYRLEDVYLYRLVAATPEKARALFLDYVKTANELHEQPQWYNELTSNCTTNIRVHVKHIGSARPWDWQLLLNGTIAERAYDLKQIDTSLPFAELKRLSHINERARAADRDPAFSSRIREGLPGIHEAWITPWLLKYSLTRSPLPVEDFSDKGRPGQRLRQETQRPMDGTYWTKVRHIFPMKTDTNF